MLKLPNIAFMFMDECLMLHMMFDTVDGTIPVVGA